MAFFLSLFTFGLDSGSPLRFWHAVLALLYGSLGLFFNILLIWLVKKCTNFRHNPSIPNELRNYSCILLTTAYIDIVFISLSMIARYGENSVSDHIGSNYTYGYGVLNWEIFQWTPIIVNYMISFAFLIALYYCQWLIAIQYLYRYFLVVRSITLSYWQYGCLLIAVLVTELPLWAVMVYNSYGNTMRLQYVNNSEQLDLLNGVHSDFDPVKICWYNYDVNSELFQLWTNIHLGYMVFYYGIIVWSGCSIFVCVQKHAKNIAGIIRQTNNQITTVLALQAILPLFFTYAPSLYIKLTDLVGTTPFTYLSLVIGMFYPWMSVVNPIISIICIGRYRSKCLEMIGWRMNYVARIIPGRSHSSSMSNYVIRPNSSANPGANKLFHHKLRSTSVCNKKCSI